MQTVPTVDLLTGASSRLARRTLAVVAGVVLVALGAQVAVPIPGTPVPVTLQVPAVLIVGGLLGPRLAAGSLALYLVLGIGGLPVFAPSGAPGLARLLGPTGGYLLAFPVAASLVGAVAGDGRTLWRTAVGVVAGLAVIYLGGVAQLAALGGDVRTALVMGSLPFLVGDVLKVTIAGLTLARFGSRTRALL